MPRTLQHNLGWCKATVRLKQSGGMILIDTVILSQFTRHAKFIRSKRTMWMTLNNVSSMWRPHNWETAWGAPVKRTSPPTSFTHAFHYHVVHCPLHHAWDFSDRDSHLVYSSISCEDACATITRHWNFDNMPSKFDSRSHKNTCATLTWSWNVNDA